METLKSLTLTALIALTSGCTDGGARYTPLVDGTRNAHFPGDLSTCQDLARAQPPRNGRSGSATFLDAALGGLVGTADDAAFHVESVVGGAPSDVVASSRDRKDIVIACMRASGHAIIG